MIILREKCNRCGRCSRYCPVNAITLNRSKKYYEVNLDKCVECYNCYRHAGCETGALYKQKLIWPRTFRNIMSDELYIAKESGISGRGTEEMKTNDVTGRFVPGEVGIAIEMGRPGTSTSVADMEKVAMKLAECGVEFEKSNPVTSIIIDKTTGKFMEETLGERCLSAIIEVKTKMDKLPVILGKLKEVEKEVNTVFSVCVACKLDGNGSNPSVKILEELGISYYPNGKLNVGLGKPFKG